MEAGLGPGRGPEPGLGPGRGPERGRGPGRGRGLRPEPRPENDVLAQV